MVIRTKRQARAVIGTNWRGRTRREDERVMVTSGKISSTARCSGAVISGRTFSTARCSRAVISGRTFSTAGYARRGSAREVGLVRTGASQFAA